MRLGFLCVFAMACHFQSQVQSSRAVLGPELSEVTVNEDAQPAALDLVKSFALRGFWLDSVQRDERGMTLRIKGDRRTVAEQLHPVADAIEDVGAALNGDTREHFHAVADVTYGSVFYVRLEQRGPADTWISIIGRPIRDGAELCTPDPDILAPCLKNDRLLSENPGVPEAEVVQSLFAELRLRGVVTSVDPTPMIVARNELAACKKRRAEQMELASRVTNSKARANIVRALPNCDDRIAQ